MKDKEIFYTPKTMEEEDKKEWKKLQEDITNCKAENVIIIITGTGGNVDYAIEFYNFLHILDNTGVSPRTQEFKIIASDYIESAHAYLFLKFASELTFDCFYCSTDDTLLLHGTTLTTEIVITNNKNENFRKFRALIKEHEMWEEKLKSSLRTQIEENIKKNGKGEHVLTFWDIISNENIKPAKLYPLSKLRGY